MKQFVQHLEIESQQQSIEWRHTIFPKKRNLRKCLQEEKLWLPNFWGEKGVIRVRVIPRGQQYSERYTEILRSLAVLLRRVHPTRKILELLLLNVIMPNTSARVTQVITGLGRKVFLHAFHSPDPTPSNFHLFDTLNDRLQRKIRFMLRTAEAFSSNCTWRTTLLGCLKVEERC